MDHDLVANLPARDFGADRPNDAGGVGAGDVIVGLMHVEDRDRLTERGPDTVVVDPGRHHHDQHLVAVDGGRVHDLDLHGGLGFAVALAPDGPGVHHPGHVAERRNLAELVELLAGGRLLERSLLNFRACRLGHAFIPSILQAPVPKIRTRLTFTQGSGFLQCTNDLNAVSKWPKRKNITKIWIIRTEDAKFRGQNDP